MDGRASMKRPHDGDHEPKAGRLPRKFGKHKKQKQYHSDSEDEEEQDFPPVDLRDSDDDILDAAADDGALSSGEESSDAMNSAEEKAAPNKKQKSHSAPPPNDSENDDKDAWSDEGSDSEDSLGNPHRKAKSKRNDPAAFATSISKILNTKLASSKRTDPVLARSAAAHEASRQVLDSALDTKARKQLRDKKRLAYEKGRVRDVLAAPTNLVVNTETGDVELEEDGETTAAILAGEKRLKKVAHRAVRKLYCAVQEAQIKAAQAERDAKAEGVVGMGRRKERVTEMSRQGFLDLLASGGGALNKKGLEEA